MFGYAQILGSLPSLTHFQYQLVDQVFLYSALSFAAASLFFFTMRKSVGANYRPVIVIFGVVVSIACYHYTMIRKGWQNAFELRDNAYEPSGVPFNDFYRYADWILTVPLLLVALVVVMRLTRPKASLLLTKLVIASTVMIACGYRGEIISSPESQGVRIIWGLAACIPFAYVIFVLWKELSAVLVRQATTAKFLLSAARWVFVTSWFVYPVAFAMGSTPNAMSAASRGTEAAGGVISLQICYAIADVASKAAFGTLIYFFIRAKTRANGSDSLPQ